MYNANLNINEGSKYMDKKNLLKVPAEISRIQTMADGGLRLFVDTQEISSKDKGLVMELHKKLGWFLFSETSIEKEDVLDLPEIKLDKGQKSPSLRLRNVLYLVWEQQGKKGSSEEFYKNYMERIIIKLKEQLN